MGQSGGELKILFFTACTHHFIMMVVMVKDDKTLLKFD